MAFCPQTLIEAVASTKSTQKAVSIHVLLQAINYYLYIPEYRTTAWEGLLSTFCDKCSVPVGDYFFVGRYHSPSPQHWWPWDRRCINYVQSYNNIDPSQPNLKIIKITMPSLSDLSNALCDIDWLVFQIRNRLKGKGQRTSYTME